MGQVHLEIKPMTTPSSHVQRVAGPAVCGRWGCLSHTRTRATYERGGGEEGGRKIEHAGKGRERENQGWRWK